jgi:phage baseplate assembly protein gpV
LIGDYSDRNHIYLGGFSASDGLTTAYDSAKAIYTVSGAHGHTNSLQLAASSYVPVIASNTANSSGFVTLTGSSTLA